MIVVLDYIRTKFGLKPSQYKKEDIKFVIKEENNNDKV